MTVVAPHILAVPGAKILDVGCGTGKAMRHIQEIDANFDVYGIDPSQELLDIAIHKHGIPAAKLLCGNGEDLPYDDHQFDFSIAMAVLHHVQDPSQVIREMMRVSRVGVIISDSNNYGNGKLYMRLAKVASRYMKVDRPLLWVRHGGKLWDSSAGDGVFRPYSVFDSVKLLKSNGRNVSLEPTKGTPNMHAFPLLSASHMVAVSWVTE